MSLFDKIDEKIKHWLLDCVDASEEYIKYMHKAAVYEEAYYKICKEAAKVCRSYEKLKSAYEEPFQVITAEIPSTTAPWYEDSEFSSALWSELKSKEVVVFSEDADKKYASIVVSSKEKVNDISGQCSDN